MPTLPSTGSRANLGEILEPLQVIEVLDELIDHAKNEGDLNLYENTVHRHREDGVDYQIRLCPALHKKEQARAPTPHIAPHPGDIQKVVETIVKHDPFTPPFNSLLVGEMKDALEEDEGGYYVLLNKFAVVRGHFLLVTKDYQSQSDPLSPSQLTQIYLLLLSAQSQNKPYFAFFNCGLLSGASQPHKHIQFLPGEPPIEKCAKGKRIENEARPFTIPSLPFSAHIKRLNREIISSASSLTETSTYTQDHDILEQLSGELSMAFMSLLDEMYHALRVEDAKEPAYRKWGMDKLDKIGEKVEPSTPSYNVVMTLGHVYLFPRVAERFTVEKDPSMESKIDPTPPLLRASPLSDAPVQPPISNVLPLPTMENPTHIHSKIDPTAPLLPASSSSDAPVPPSITTNPPLHPATNVPDASLANPPNTSLEQDEPYLSLSVNSLGFAGMLLVKSEDELERVIKIGIGQILKSVGRRPLIVVLDGKEDRGHDDVFAELA